MNDKNSATRIEKDQLGQKEIPADALTGIHTARAKDNFPLALCPVHPALIHAYGSVKRAAASTNRALGYWADNPLKADAIENACQEMADGRLDEHIIVDALQGGAGTSTNMNVNEVLANRTLQLMGEKPGNYRLVSPLDDINLHQSTNDTYPTALKLAAIVLFRLLEKHLVTLQEEFQNKENAFAHIVKIARTELQDAVLITLGREMGAYAEAINRDRWRIYKCEERLRIINLGGTAIGTGLAAPRQYIFQVVDTLRDQTGIGFARAENLVENTQNADVFVEVSGMLKACASTLIKISTDLRLLASGPSSGFGEITLPAVQAGSSIMPGKINPVIPEAVTQAAMRVISHDLEITMAAAAGNLELNPFLPLIADALLHGIELLTNSIKILYTHCIRGIEANEDRCYAHVENSTAIITALLPVLGYAKATEAVQQAQQSKQTIRRVVVEGKMMSAEEFDRLISPEAVTRLGTPSKKEP